MKQYDNNEKLDQRGLEEVLLFCIEEVHDTSDGWCINKKIDIVKNKKIKNVKHR